MSSRREAAVAAVVAAIAAALPLARVEREADAPVSVGASGHVVIRDGDVSEPDVTLGIARNYWWSHAIDIEVYARGSAVRFSALDDMLMIIDDALAADRTIGEAVDDCAWRIDQLNDATSDGAESIRCALVALTVNYQTDTPLG